MCRPRSRLPRRWNELRTKWQERGERALFDYGSLADDRSRVLLLNGEPINRCRHLFQELEIWFYAGSERTDREFVLVFERPTWKVPYRLLRPMSRLIRTPRETRIELSIDEMCQEGTIQAALDLIRRDPQYDLLLQDILTPEDEPSEEWVATFAAQSTALPADARSFAAELSRWRQEPPRAPARRSRRRSGGDGSGAQHRCRVTGGTNRCRLGGCGRSGPHQGVHLV